MKYYLVNIVSEYDYGEGYKLSNKLIKELKDMDNVDICSINTYLDNTHHYMLIIESIFKGDNKAILEFVEKHFCEYNIKIKLIDGIKE